MMDWLLGVMEMIQGDTLLSEVSAITHVSVKENSLTEA